MKGVFFIWQWTWNIPSCHSLRIVNGMGSQSCNWFKTPQKYELNNEKEYVNLLLFFVICCCWNYYLLEIMFSISYYLLEFLLLIGRDVCWKCCSPIITTCCKNCYLLEELLFSNCCHLLKELLFFNYCSCYLIEELLLSFFTPSILAHQNPQKGEQLTRMMMTKAKTQNIGGV